MRLTPKPAPTGTTAVAGVIGDPVHHSLSPVLHNAAFAACGLDWTYVAFPVPAGAGHSAVEAMRTLGLRGLSVTMPHKEAVAEAADHRSPVVEALGAANCLVLDRGLVAAHNTDGVGFIEGLAAEAGMTVHGLSIAVIGAGGAARAVIHACAGAGAARIAVINRNETRGRAAVELAGGVGVVGSDADISGADLVINATPVGMGGDRSLPSDPAILTPSHTVVDLVYDPWETAWLKAARQSGATVFNGFPMLLHQAAAQFGLWTGREAQLAEMASAARREMNRA